MSGQPRLAPQDRYNAQGERWCSGCLQYLPLEAPWEPTGTTFGPVKNHGDGLDSYCRACRRYLNKQDYKRHKPGYMARRDRWRAAHPEAWRDMNRRANRVLYWKHKLAAEFTEERQILEEGA